MGLPRFGVAENLEYVHTTHPLDGYRRTTFMMLDQDVVAVCPTTTCHVLSAAGVLDRWVRKPTKKGTGFVQPLVSHEHWHFDIAYLNVGGIFRCFCSVRDGVSRAIAHHEIRESMKEAGVELILQRAREKHPRREAAGDHWQRPAVRRA